MEKTSNAEKNVRRTSCLEIISKFLPKYLMNLTLSRRSPLLYRNHSIDLLCKSMDWFLYNNGLRLERVKVGLLPSKNVSWLFALVKVL